MFFGHDQDPDMLIFVDVQKPSMTIKASNLSYTPKAKHKMSLFYKQEFLIWFFFLVIKLVYEAVYAQNSIYGLFWKTSTQRLL